MRIPLKDGTFWQKEFNQNDTIEKVAQDFKKENNIEIPKDCFMGWNCKNHQIEMTDKLKSLLNYQIPTLCINPEIKRRPLTIENREINPSEVGKPFNNPFEIYVFNKEDKTLKIQNYPHQLICNKGLEIFNNTSAYCNGENHLYISGGENENYGICEKLWDINLNTQEIKEPVQIWPKKNHSMIFIPKKYVFLVGGNDKSTYCYDCETKEVFQWADLNFERTEPALEKIGNFLYCFDNIKKTNDERLTFEKSNLISDKPCWQLIIPEIDPTIGYQKFSQKFFGVSRDFQDNVIFLGGNMDDEKTVDEIKNYKYNAFTNYIDFSDVTFKEINFKEKTFLPYNRNIDFLFPDFNRQHPEVIFYVKNRNKLEKMNFTRAYSTQPILNQGININLNDIKPDIKFTANKINFNMPKFNIPEVIPDSSNLIQPKKNEQNFIIHNDQLNNQIIDTNLYSSPSHINIVEPQNIKIIKPEIDFNHSNLNNVEIPNPESKIDINLNSNNLNNSYLLNSKSKIPHPYHNYTPNRVNSKPYIDVPFCHQGIDIPRFHVSVNDPGNDIYVNKAYTLSHSQYLKNEKTPVKNDLDFPKYQNTSYINGTPNPNYEKFNLSGSIQGTKLKNNSVNMTNPRTKISDPNLNVDFKDQNIYLNNNLNQNFDIKGNIPGVSTNSNIKTSNIDLSGSKIDKKNVQVPNLNFNANINNSNINVPVGKDYNMSGCIPGTKIKSQSVDKKTQKNKKEKNFGMSGTIKGIPGLKSSVSNMSASNLNVKGPNITFNENNINSNISGMKLGTSGNVNIPNPNVNVKAPSVNVNPPNYNLSGNISGVKQVNSNVNLPSGNVNLKGPNVNINPPDLNISGTIPGIKTVKINTNIPNSNVNVKAPNVNVNPPNYNINSNISGVKLGSNNVNIPSGNVNLNGPNVNLKSPNVNVNPPDLNLSGTIPGIKTGKVNMNLPNNNINITAPKVNVNSGNINGVKLGNENINTHNTNLNANKPNININPPNYNLSGNIPGVKLETNNVNLPSGNVNLNGPNVNLKGPNVKVSQPDFKLSGTIKGIKIAKPSKNTQNPNLNITAPNVNVNSSNINGVKLGTGNVNLPNANLNVSEPNVNVNPPNYNLSGNISGVKLANNNVNIPSGNVNLNGPNVNLKPQNVVVNPPDINISGTIPGIKTGKVKMNVPNTNVNVKAPNLNMSSGNINGVKLGNENVNIPSANLTVNEPNVNMPSYNLSENISGVKLGASNINIPSGNINLKEPNVNTNLQGGVNLKNPNPPNFNLSGIIKGNPKFKVKPTKITVPSANTDIQPPNISGNLSNTNVNITNPNISVSGNIPQNSQNINLKSPNINMPSTNINVQNPELNVQNQNIKIEAPKINMNNYNMSGSIPGTKLTSPSSNINIKNPNTNLQNNNDIDLKGTIPGIKVQVPNVNLPNGGAKINLQEPNINTQNYNLNGNLNPQKINIPSNEINLNAPKIEMQNPNVNLKTNIQNPSSNIKSEIPENKFDISVPNYQIAAPDFNQPELKKEDSSEIFLLKGTIKGIKIPKNNKKVKNDTDLNDNIGYNKNFHGNIDDPKYDNHCNLKGNRIAGKTSTLNDPNQEIKVNKGNLDCRVSKIVDEKNVVIEEPFAVLKNQSYINDNIKLSKPEINSNSSYNYKYNPYGNDLNFNMPVPCPDINTNIKNQNPNIEINNPSINLNMDNNLKEHMPTNLRFSPIPEDSDINPNMHNNFNMQSRGLPSVGIKANNFKPSRVESGGQFYTENVDVGNMMSANVGINGVKMNNRIIE